MSKRADKIVSEFLEHPERHAGVSGEYACRELAELVAKARAFDAEWSTDHLDGLARRAADALVALMADDATTGGCRPFYTPDEWRARGESYGLTSVLVCCHDGGTLSHMLDLSQAGYDVQRAVRDALTPLGLFVEQCTGWYSAVYRL